MLAIVAAAGLLAQSINLPGVVGAFLAGLAVNTAVKDKPAILAMRCLAKLYPVGG